MRRSSPPSPPSACSSSGVCTASPAPLQPVAAQDVHQLRRPFRPVDQAEPSTAAEQIRCRSTQLVKGAGGFGPGRAPSSLRHPSCVGREIGRIGHAQVETPGFWQSCPIPQVGPQHGNAVLQTIDGGVFFRQRTGSTVDINVGDVQFLLPRQQQEAQQADPGAQVTDALTTPHFGKVSQQERVGGGLEHVVVKAEAKTARPQLIPVLHAASSSAHSCTIR